jgi:hypothetical protein
VDLVLGQHGRPSASNVAALLPEICIGNSFVSDFLVSLGTQDPL